MLVPANMPRLERCCRSIRPHSQLYVRKCVVASASRAEGTNSGIPDVRSSVDMAEAIVGEIMVPHPICFRVDQTIK